MSSSSEIIKPPAEGQPLPDDDLSLQVTYSRSYQNSSPYNPKVYKCTGYGNDDYEYFDGAADPNRDQRLTIDIEHGTTDHLRDVRPYLYYVGFLSDPRTTDQPEIENGITSDVEEAYVKLGKEFLVKARSLQRGYFLRKRDWGVMNEGYSERFPFYELVHSDSEEGDQGCERAHDGDEYFQDCCGKVLITNIRTSLPELPLINTRPDRPDWDRFIQWIYSADLHGIRLFVEHMGAAKELEERRIADGLNPHMGWYI